MERTFNHLTLEQRKQLREMLDAGCKKPEIAQALNTHVSTVYREIKRGSVTGAMTLIVPTKHINNICLKKGQKLYYRLTLNLPNISQVLS